MTVLFIRGGRMLGSRNYFPRASYETDRDEIIRAFLLQYYPGRGIPKEVIVSEFISDGDILQTMFSEKAGHRVALRHRVRGDRRRWLEMAHTNAVQGASLRARSNDTIGQQLDALGQLLELDERPERLECFDVSHLSGDLTVASCVVFGSEGPLKSEYRRFNIEGVEAGDDYGAMAQAVSRRYARLKRRGSLTGCVIHRRRPRPVGKSSKCSGRVAGGGSPGGWCGQGVRAQAGA